MSSIGLQKRARVLAGFVLTALLCVSSQGVEKVGIAPDWSKGAVEYATLEGHKQGIESAVFSPDGRYVTLGNKDFHANIWEVSSGKSLALLEGLNEWPVNVAYSPDGRFLAAADYDKVRLWDVPSGDSFAVLEKCGRIFAFSPDGSHLATNYKPFNDLSRIKLWAFPSGELKKTVEAVHEKPIRYIAWSPEGNLVVSCSDDGTLKLWDAESLEALRTIQGEGRVQFFSFSPDGRYIAAISGEDPGHFFKPAVVMVWEVSTGKLVTKIEGFENGLEPIAFGPDGEYLVTGERKGDGAKASFWEVPSGKLIRTFEGHKYWVSKLAFSPDGRFLATGSADEVTLWNVSTGKKLWTITAATQGLTCIRFSPDGTCLATTSTDNTAKLWRVKE